MKPSEETPNRHPPWALIAVALALSLVGCEQKPPDAGAGKGIERPADKPAPRPEQAVGKTGAQMEPAKAAAGKQGADQAAGDAALAAKVKAALAAEPGLNAHAIDVVAAAGVVTLYGTADTLAKRDRAVQIATSIQGVKTVDNKLVIVSGS